MKLVLKTEIARDRLAGIMKYDEKKQFDNNYMACITLANVVNYPVAGCDTAGEYLDYFFNQFPIVGWSIHDNILTVWGNRWPVEVVIGLLENITEDVERLS
jgi:hypothetical protein